MADFLSRRDVDFLLHEWLDVTALTKRDHFAEHSRDTFDAVLDLSADIASKCFAPHNKKGDQTQPVVGADGKVVLIDEIKTASQYNVPSLARSCHSPRQIRPAMSCSHITTVQRLSMALSAIRRWFEEGECVLPHGGPSLLE